MAQITLTIPGKPYAQQRPRFYRAGRFVKTYDTLYKEKRQIVALISSQVGNELIQEPLRVELNFFLEIPKSYSRKKRERCLFGLIAHTKKPDLDNMAKFYLDCMNKIVYRDDSQIYELIVSKHYSDSPKTLIAVNYD